MLGCFGLHQQSMLNILNYDVTFVGTVYILAVFLCFDILVSFV